MENNNKELNGVKKMIADRIVTQEAAEKYFPELKESEDEKILRVLKEGFEIYNKGEWYGGITNEQILAWLEKQGEQKPAWSEDDEGICRAIINDIANDKSMCTFDISKGICDEQINWLKSLKDRVQSQPKQKWNEEDDMMIDETLYFLIEYQQSDRCKDENDMQNSVTCENWLKSLKERVACEANCTTAKQWKPSEEQIKELEFFISELPKCSVVAQKIIKKGKDTLVSLLSDLKKLREE